jgi:hypothetical protein
MFKNRYKNVSAPLNNEFRYIVTNIFRWSQAFYGLDNIKFVNGSYR